MISIIGAIIFVIGLLMLYALVIRPWLKNQPWAQKFLAWVEPIEIALFKKSETVLVGRLVWVGGLFVSAYDGLAQFASSLDLTPLTTRIFDALHIPPDLRGLTVSAFVMGVGLAVVKLRKQTTKPLELVAVADKDVTPKVAEAIAMAGATNVEAVAVVAEQKAA